MTVFSSTSRNDYIGNGVTTSFPVTFRFLENSHLRVLRTVIATNVTTELTLDSLGPNGYSVTGAGQPSGGTVTVVTAPANITERLSILRDVPVTQEIDYIANDPFPAESHERGLDKLTMIVGQQGEVVNRAIVLAPQTTGVSNELPGPVALNLIRWKADLSGLENAAPPAIATVAPGAVVDATVSPIAGIQGTKLNFLQTGTGAVNRTVQDKQRERVSVKDFGAVGDNTADDTAAIQAAVTAVIAAGGGEVFFPKGTYKISAEISITSPVTLRGRSQRATVIRQTNATANGFNFNYPALTEGGGVEGMTIEAGAGYRTAGFTATGSTGTGLRMNLVNDNFFVQDVAIQNFARGAALLGCWTSKWVACRILFAQFEGLYIGKGSIGNIGGGNTFLSVKISNNGFTGPNGASRGVLIDASGGEQFYGCDTTKENIGWLIQPAVASQVLYLWMDSCLSDTTDGAGIVFDGTNGPCWSHQLHNCWSAYSVAGSGLVTLGANLDGIKWVGGRLRENGINGWEHNGGTNIDLIGVEIAANSAAAANTHAGVRVAAGVSNWSVDDCRIGNFASSLSTQADGIQVLAGASTNYRITDNSFRNTGAGKSPINNAASTDTALISGNLPVQVAGSNESRGGPLPICTNGTVAAGTTVFIGPNGQFAAEDDAAMAPGRPAVISRIFVSSVAAPGVGQTYTYTLRKNGANTGLSAVLTGANNAALMSGASVTYNANDLFDIALNTSAGAVVTRHRVTIILDP